AVALLLLLTLAVPGPPPARAATLTVTDCGDSGGPNQLRQVIAAAAPGDTINWMTPCMTTLTTAMSPLTIIKDLTITGVGAQKTIIDGGGITRIFVVSVGSVAISNLTLQHGNGTPGGAGGALFISLAGVTLTNVIVSGNSATEGGGLENLGTLTLRNSTV